MSLIYKSLQQLRKEEETKKRRRKIQAPEAVAPGMRKVIQKFLLYVSSIVLFIFITMFWLRSEIRQIIALTAQQVKTSGTVQTISESDKPKKEQKAKPVVMVSNVLPEVKQVVHNTLPQLKKKKKTKKVEELKKPTIALEKHFTRQANKNQALLEVQSKLITEVSAGRVEKVKKELTVITKKLGEKSFYRLKWEGYLALKEKNYAEAEALYRKALAKNPMDKEARINLTLALLGQKKRTEAEKIYKQLKSEFPMDEVVAKLGTAF
ncbi:tetratricopeptide repeat protein [Desulfovulcanus sp.]